MSSAIHDPRLRILVLRTAQDLELLSRSGTRKARAILLLRVPRIEPDQRRRWEAALNAKFNACGCASGAAFALLAFAIAVVWQSRYGGWSIAHWAGFALRAIVVSLLSGGIGKAVGRALAHVSLRRLARAIQRRVASNGIGDPPCQAARSG